MRRKFKTNILRRFRVVDRIFALAYFIMRSCQFCSSQGVMYRVTKQSLECENYYRHNLKCDLALDYQSMNKALKEVEKLKNEILKLRLRLARKEKQRKHWRRRLKDFDDRESRNILKIEAKKIIDELSSNFVNNTFSLSKFFSQTLTTLFDFFVVEIFKAILDNSQGSWVILMYFSSWGIPFTLLNIFDLFFAKFVQSHIFDFLVIDNEK